MERVNTNIENLENEAEKSLEEAKVKAAEILTKANAESQTILSSPMNLDQINSECSGIIAKAKSDSEGKIIASRQEAENLKKTATQKVDDIVTRMTRLITEA